MKATETPETLTILYDGACPLCRREIAYASSLARKQAGSALCFVDISSEEGACVIEPGERAALLARFHVQRADGSRLSGAEAFVAMWSRLPGWRWLARLSRLPGMLAVMEGAYRGFLRLRRAGQAQAQARRLGYALPRESSGGLQ